MLGHVRERLGDDEVGRPLDRGRQPLAGRQVAPDGRRHGPPGGDRAERRHEAAIEQDRRGDPADEVAQLGQRLAGLLLAVEDELLRGGRIGVDPLARQAQVDRQHHQALLGAVVEVALDPVQLARLDVEDGRAALLERLDLAPELAALGGAQEAGDDRRGGGP